jgi:hypothetical protein
MSPLRYDGPTCLCVVCRPTVKAGRRGFRFEGQLAFDRVISGGGFRPGRTGAGVVFEQAKAN